MFERLKFIFLGVTLSLLGSVASGSSDIKSSQIMLNQLGYKAGPADGIVGSKTTNAMTNYYADKGMTFDGTIDGNEVALLKTDVGNLELSVEEKANELGVTLSGHYIDETMKNKVGKYILPTDKWFFRHINGDRGVFYKTGSSFGDWDGDGNLDYLGFGAGVACMGQGGTVKEGRVGCDTANALYNPILPFSVDSSFNYSKLTKVFNFNGTAKKGFANNVQRIIVEDFNGDGIDDIFVPNASVKLKNGKFSYKAINHVLISTGPNSWKQSKHTGTLVDKKTGTFQGFSHGSDAGDIDNDGDIDVITTDISKGIICHYNDGKGNFNAKVCINKVSFTVTVGDFNNDGNLDIVGGNAHYNAEYRKQSAQSFLKETKNSHYIALYYGNGKGKFKRVHKLEPAKVGNFPFSEVPEMTAFDFDNDGDLDIVSSVVGMYYSGSAWVAYENVNGKLQLADVNITMKPLDEWQDPKQWGKMVKNEMTQWNTYCNKSILIDVNSDGLMDAMCSNVVQDMHMSNHFIINKGNMEFDVVSPDEVKKWVHWINE